MGGQAAVAVEIALVRSKLGSAFQTGQADPAVIAVAVVLAHDVGRIEAGSRGGRDLAILLRAALAEGRAGADFSATAVGVCIAPAARRGFAATTGDTHSATALHVAGAANTGERAVSGRRRAPLYAAGAAAPPFADQAIGTVRVRPALPALSRLSPAAALGAHLTGRAFAVRIAAAGAVQTLTDVRLARAIGATRGAAGSVLAALPGATLAVVVAAGAWTDVADPLETDLSQGA